ncbi:MAG: HAMP domain-containing histidine kinase [Proteobacteria bacterium]|nr:HAMP domain-containing histidine kinase [Pseudomonadota bacterium]
MPGTAQDLFERDVATLAALWFDRRRDWDDAWAHAQPLLLAARSRGDLEVEAMTQAFGAVRLALVELPTPERSARLQALLATVRAAPCRRAQRLGEAAGAYLQVYAGTEAQRRALAQVAELAARQLEEAQDPGQPPASTVERFCVQLVEFALHAFSGDFDGALQCSLKMQPLLHDPGGDALLALFRGTLGYVFLSVGDVEAAYEPLHANVVAWRRLDYRSARSGYDLLLCLLLAGRNDEAATLVAQDRWLLEPVALDGAPVLADLLALVLARQGRRDEADRLLDWPLPDWVSKYPAVLANRAWVRATVHLLHGRAQAARDEVEGCLARLAERHAAITPMNATQLHRVRSEACEALGDVGAALQALKASQAHCFSWVGSAMQARLDVLHAGAQHGLAEQQLQRTAAVNAAVAEARRLGEEADIRVARQQRFLSHVTHEMRNPLNGVLGMTSLLMMSDLDERQRRYLSLAQSSAQMLLALCNDVLDLAKIDAGRFELSLQPVAVAALMAEAAAVMQPLLQGRPVTLAVQVDPTLPDTLLTDRLRLQQVLLNLLSNAVKFTRKGRIEVEAVWSAPAALANSADSADSAAAAAAATAAPAERDATGTLRIEVRDTGVGISAQGQERLFKEFSQVNIEDQQRGTGLGLALCRSLVALMGGQIGVHSVEGQGSCFWLTLPLRPGDALAPPAERAAGAARPPAGRPRAARTRRPGVNAPAGRAGESVHVAAAASAAAMAAAGTRRGARRHAPAPAR